MSKSWSMNLLFIFRTFNIPNSKYFFKNSIEEKTFLKCRKIHIMKQLPKHFLIRYHAFYRWGSLCDPIYSAKG